MWVSFLWWWRSSWHTQVGRIKHGRNLGPQTRLPLWSSALYYCDTTPMKITSEAGVVNTHENQLKGRSCFFWLVVSEAPAGGSYCFQSYGKAGKDGEAHPFTKEGKRGRGRAIMSPTIPNSTSPIPPLPPTWAKISMITCLVGVAKIILENSFVLMKWRTFYIWKHKLGKTFC